MHKEIQEFPYNKMIQPETQDEIRNLIYKSLIESDKTWAQFGREARVSKCAVYKWFIKKRPARYLTVCKYVLWLFEANKNKDFEIKSLDMIVKGDDGQATL